MPLPCFTDEQTALYRRGYPHLIELVDGHKDDKKPDPTKVFAKKYAGIYHVQWPRKVAQAFVRACTTQQSHAVTTSADASPIGLDDARAALARQLATPRQRGFHADPALVFCIEALLGSDAALALLVDVLRELPAERWPISGSAFDPDAQPKPEHMAPAIHRDNLLGANGSVGYYAYLAGYLLLRASAAVAAEARAALEALWQRTVDAGVPAGEASLRGGLDLALHGNEGAHRNLADSHWQYLHWWGFVDDSALMRARLTAKLKSEWLPDPRHIWLMPDLIDVLLSKKVIKKIDNRAAFFRDVGMFDHPAVVQLMRDHVEDKKAGAVARAWLDEHGLPA